MRQLIIAGPIEFPLRECADESLMIVGRGVDQMAEQFQMAPFARPHRTPGKL